MSSGFAYILMVHMVGSTAMPYWQPLDEPIVIYQNADDCTKRAGLFQYAIPRAVFGCPTVVVR